MTIYDLTYLFTENYQKITIYELNSEKTIYNGTIADLDYQLENLEIASIDCVENNTITINVDIEEEELAEIMEELEEVEL